MSSKPRWVVYHATAAVASPSPDALDAGSHPTDVAILRGARVAGLDGGLTERDAESPFDPARSFHATLASDHVTLAGAGAATRVRYCWGDSPVCTLTDTSGLPAGPFELAILP